MVRVVHSKINTILFALIINCITLEVANCYLESYLSAVASRLSELSGLSALRNAFVTVRINDTLREIPQASVRSVPENSQARVRSLRENSQASVRSVPENYLLKLFKTKYDNIDAELCQTQIKTDLNCFDAHLCAVVMFETKLLNSLKPSTKKYVSHLYGKIVKKTHSKDEGNASDDEGNLSGGEGNLSGGEGNSSDDEGNPSGGQGNASDDEGNASEDEGNPSGGDGNNSDGEDTDLLEDIEACDLLEELFFWRTNYKFAETPKIEATFKDTTTCTYHSEKVQPRRTDTSTYKSIMFLNPEQNYLVLYSKTEKQSETDCMSLENLYYAIRERDSAKFNFENVQLNTSRDILFQFTEPLARKKAVTPKNFCSADCDRQVSIAFNYYKEPSDIFAYAFLYTLPDDLPYHAVQYLIYLTQFSIVNGVLTPTMYCEELVESTLQEQARLQTGNAQNPGEFVKENIELETLKCKTQMIYAKLDQSNTNIDETSEFATEEFAGYVLHRLSLRFVSQDIKYAAMFMEKLMADHVKLDETLELLSPPGFCDSLKSGGPPKEPKKKTPK